MTCAILGAGSWGTALAIHLGKQGQRVLLWGRDKHQINNMRKTHCNNRYLPLATLPPSVEPVSDLNQCVKEATIFIIAVPSHAFMSLFNRLSEVQSGIAWITKGIDPTTQSLFSDLITKQRGTDFPLAVISGPSFAKEVAEGLPTALVVATRHQVYQQTICQLLHDNELRVYTSDDLIGVQLCGAIKNILAIACGISDGLQLGANAKAALITRGLAEMRRLGLSMGANAETFFGLAGVGDLVLTCTDDQSRNRRFGLQLGQGIERDTALRNIGQVVEGTHNAIQICALAAQYHVDMPICQEVNALLQQQCSPQDAVKHLMERPSREEN